MESTLYPTTYSTITSALRTVENGGRWEMRPWETHRLKYALSGALAGVATARLAPDGSPRESKSLAESATSLADALSLVSGLADIGFMPPDVSARLTGSLSLLRSLVERELTPKPRRRASISFIFNRKTV